MELKPEYVRITDAETFTPNPVNWAAGNPARQTILNRIIGKEFRWYLKRNGIKKDLIVGFLGERGGGKSASAACVAMIDFMMDGITCFSNMKIGMRMAIPDELAARFGIPYGQYGRFQSLPIDMPALLRFDLKYKNSCLLIDEINVEISEARRSMSNTNLFSNRLGQELRHLESALLYTSINEMYVDSRLRELTDCFIKCSDTANTRDGIARRKPSGVDFKWTVYFMSSCFIGETYSETHKYAREEYFHFKPWWGIYDDKEFQGENKLKYGYSLKDFTGGSSEMVPGTMRGSFDRWQWLDDLVVLYRESGMIEVACEDLWSHEEAKRLHIYRNDISEHLKQKFGIVPGRFSEDGERNSIYKL